MAVIFTSFIHNILHFQADISKYLMKQSFNGVYWLVSSILLQEQWLYNVQACDYIYLKYLFKQKSVSVVSKYIKVLIFEFFFLNEQQIST